MTHYFKNLPHGIFNEFGDWQSRVAACCPLSNTPIEYANNNRVTLSYEKVDGSLGNADLITRKTFVDPDQCSGLPDFLNTSSHEIKHIRHVDSHDAVIAWTELGKDLSHSRAKGKPLSRRNYALPSIVDAILIYIITEMDCHAYGEAAEREAQIALGGKIWRPVTQTRIEAIHRHYMQDDNLQQSCLVKEMQFIDECIDDLIYHEQQHDFRPYISWMPVPMQAMQRITMPFWEDNHFLSGFAGKDGVHDIRALRGQIVSDPRLQYDIEYCQEALLDRKNYVPAHRAAMAQYG